MTTDSFCFYLQNGLIQTSQTGGQWYSDTSPFSIPCTNALAYFAKGKSYITLICGEMGTKDEHNWAENNPPLQLFLWPERLFLWTWTQGHKFYTFFKKRVCPRVCTIKLFTAVIYRFS
jgi:hypothetical protein